MDPKELRSVVGEEAQVKVTLLWVSHCTTILFFECAIAAVPPSKPIAEDYVLSSDDL